MRCEARTLDDIRALGGNDARRRAPVRGGRAGVGDQPRALPHLRAALSSRPWSPRPVPRRCARCTRCACSTRCLGRTTRSWRWVGEAAERCAESASPVACGQSVPRAAGEVCRGRSSSGLDGWRKVDREDRPRNVPRGLRPARAAGRARHRYRRVRRAPRKAATRAALHAELVAQRIAELRAHDRARAGCARPRSAALLYVGMARACVDERGFEAIRRLAARDDRRSPRLTLRDFKALVREQFLMLLIDEEAALAAIPGLLPPGCRGAAAALWPLIQRGARRAVRSGRGRASGSKRMCATLFDVAGRPCVRCSSGKALAARGSGS